MKVFLAHLDEPVSVDVHISCTALATRRLQRQWACLVDLIVETVVLLDPVRPDLLFVVRLFLRCRGSV